MMAPATRANWSGWRRLAWSKVREQARINDLAMIRDTRQEQVNYANEISHLFST